MSTQYRKAYKSYQRWTQPAKFGVTPCNVVYIQNSDNDEVDAKHNHMPSSLPESYRSLHLLSNPQDTSWRLGQRGCCLT